MSLIMFILYTALIGVAVWMIETYIPMPDPFKIIIRVIVVIAVILWFLQITGLTGPAMPRFTH